MLGPPADLRHDAPKARIDQQRHHGHGAHLSGGIRII